MTWKITNDVYADPQRKKGTLSNAVGLMGPRNCKVLQDKDMPFEFRMYDDDGLIYYEGITDKDPMDSDEEDVFAPLNDFGTPNAGATRIEYKIGGKWVTV
jgi:hypothetical protein